MLFPLNTFDSYTVLLFYFFWGRGGGNNKQYTPFVENCHLLMTQVYVKKICTCTLEKNRSETFKITSNLFFHNIF